MKRERHCECVAEADTRGALPERFTHHRSAVGLQVLVEPSCPRVTARAASNVQRYRPVLPPDGLRHAASSKDRGNEVGLDDHCRPSCLLWIRPRAIGDTGSGGPHQTGLGMCLRTRQAPIAIGPPEGSLAVASPPQGQDFCVALVIGSDDHRWVRTLARP